MNQFKIALFLNNKVISTRLPQMKVSKELIYRNEKIDLRDVTFLIPVRIDSEDRMINLKLVIEFIKQHFETKIIVLEADNEEQFFNDLIDKKFVDDDNPVFHRTHYINQLTKLSKSPFIAIWDTDVLILPSQIIEAVNLLRTDKADMVFPYDGRFYNTPALIRDIYKNKKTFDVFVKNIDKFKLAYGTFSVGGAFIVNRKEYIKAGMENEKFNGWGPEDIERVKRWEILGNRIKRIEGSLFHLYHPRGNNSWFYNSSGKVKMQQELINICKHTKKTLIQEIKSWNQ